MLKNKNLCLYITIGIFLVFTVGYFITINKVSYAFTDNAREDLYSLKIKLIEKSAKLYGENNMDLFKEKKSIYVKVSDLVEANYITADDEEGNVFDPSSEVKKLNDLKIRITNKNGKISAKAVI